MEQPRTKNILPLVSVVTFFGFIDNNLLMAVIALYAAELGAGVGIIGIIVGLYSITNTPANILWGRLVDRIGYKIPLIAGLVGDTISMFLYSLCRLPFSLALVRSLHGITGAAIGPATMSAIAQHGREDRQGRAMAYYGIALGISTIAGFGLSGIIASRLGYKAIFYIGMGLVLVGTIVGLLLPRKRQSDATESMQPRGYDWRKVATLFRRRRLMVGYSAIFAQYFTFGGVVTLLPLYVKSLGMEAFHVGILMTAFAVVFVILQMPVGDYSDRVGRLGLIIAGLCLGTITIVLMPYMTTFPWLIIVMAGYGAAYGMIFPSVSALVSDETSIEERGIATGLFHALLTAGVAIGAPVIGWIGSSLGVETGLMSSAGILVLALLLLLISSRRGFK